MFGTKPPAAPIERAVIALADGVQELARQQKTVLASTLIEVLNQQKRIFERLGLLMSDVQDLNKLQSQLSIDTDQAGKDITNQESELKSNIAALYQVASFLKQENSNLDLTVLNATIKTFDANIQKLVTTANSSVAATAAAQTTISSQLQGIKSGDTATQAK